MYASAQVKAESDFYKLRLREQEITVNEVYIIADLVQQSIFY